MIIHSFTKSLLLLQNQIIKKLIFWGVLTYHERKISVELYVQYHNRSNLCLVFGDENFREYVENDPGDLDRILLAPNVGYMD